MEYRVEELAAQAGVGVDTVRFYQARGLIPPPRREGRIALYGDAHLARLLRIRAWLRDGVPLALIKRIFDRARDDSDASLLAAVATESLGERTLTRAELAAESGLPEGLLRAAEAAGLLEPIRVGEEPRFSDADLQMVRAGLEVLGAGFPLDALLELAATHARQIEEVAERAIELFDRHVRKAPNAESESVTRRFRSLLPQVTRLVALHFQRTLVTRALQRLAQDRDDEALSEALAVAESSRLEVRWR